MERKHEKMCIPKGNDFTLVVKLERKMASPSGDTIMLDVAEMATEVTLITPDDKRMEVPKAAAGMDAHDLQWAVADVPGGKAVAVTVPCDVQRLGGYGLEVVGAYADGSHWRYKAKAGEAFKIVDATSDQNVPDGQVMVYAIHGTVGIGVLAGGGGGEFTQVQSDWDQTDDTAVDFIKNKPTLFDGDYESLRNIPTIPNVSNKEDKVSIHEEETGITALSAVVGAYHVIPGTVTSLTVTLPTMTAATKIQGLVIYLKTGSGTPDIHFTSSHDVVLPKGFAPEADTIYELNCIFIPLGWVVSYAAFEAQT